MKKFGLVIHGGAGVIERALLGAKREARCRAKLKESLAAGYAVLERDGLAVDAVISAVRVLEDSPLFNAGRGAVLNADGICELDAAIMDGRSLAAGAVAGLHHIRNPISLARSVMERSPHVMMIGEGAEVFAKSLKYRLVPNSYFQTSRARRALEKVQRSGSPFSIGADGKHGTVGCAALDQHGNLAAGTSTGGITNKRFGRVGDTPVIGAGTYANNATCALSCTGAGEYFIRAVVGHAISAQMEYSRFPLARAAQAALNQVASLGGDGGLVAIDRKGNVALPFNTRGMYRGFRLSGGRRQVGIYRDT